MPRRDPSKKLSQQVLVDDGKDFVIVFGQNYAALFFETLSVPTPHGTWFRVVESEDKKAITVHVRRDLIIPNTN